MAGADNKYGAAGPMLGYLYQCRQALLLAIELSKRFPSLSISIERFDDVALQEGSTPTLQAQLKHHISPGLLSDTSADIWKTLRIWSEQVKVNPQLPFEIKFAIITTGTAGVSSAAALLRPGRRKEDEEAALKLLETAAVTSANEATKVARQVFLALTMQERRSLVGAILVFDNAPNITNARSEIADLLNFATPIEHIEKLVDHLEGWWFAAVVRSLTDSNEPSISLLTLRSKIDEIAAAFRYGDLLLHPNVEAPPDAEDLASDSRTFVRQMRCVGLPQPSVDGAKRDFYRATTQRSEWVRESALLDGEAQRYDDALVDRWERECLAQADGTDLSSDEKKQAHGRNVFHWANRSQVPFRNRHEAWLTTGSYHVLSESIRVGWHPDFRKLFPSAEEE
jgi:hypothetical protein